MKVKDVAENNIAITIIGLAAGLIISAVDNFAFGGEVSPIVIVILIFIATILFGAILGMRGSLPSVIAWAILPLTHLAKYLLNLHDTLNPNTYASIMKLAIFAFIISAIGFGCGIMLNKIYKVME